MSRLLTTQPSILKQLAVIETWLSKLLKKSPAKEGSRDKDGKKQPLILQCLAAFCDKACPIHNYQYPRCWVKLRKINVQHKSVHNYAGVTFCTIAVRLLDRGVGKSFLHD